MKRLCGVQNILVAGTRSKPQIPWAQLAWGLLASSWGSRIPVGSASSSGGKVGLGRYQL